MCDRLEYWDEDRDLEGVNHPTSHEVAVDVATGICVALRPVGGGPNVSGFEVTILDIDAEHPDTYFRE